MKLLTRTGSALLLSSLLTLAVAADEKPSVRPMEVHVMDEMGIEVVTESLPDWIVSKQYIQRKPVLLITTPSAYYPPASMTVVSFAGLSIPSEAFDEVAETALAQGLVRYGVSEEAQQTLERKARRYGELEGYELNFSARVHGEDSDVKLFIGRDQTHGPVLLQAYTLKEKMAHLAPVIERSWSNVRYLDTAVE